jgi:dimethylargininase
VSCPAGWPFQSESPPMITALTRAVAPSIARCELTHLARAPIDLDLASCQHDEYEAALRLAGCAVVRIRPEPKLPDSVFIEDTAVVLDELAVIPRPGAASRRAETDSTHDALSPFRRIESITAPGTLDGGDVLVAGRDVFAGVGGRSNEEGVRQLRDFLAPFGYRVLGVVTTGCLHLKSAATLVADSCVLVNPSWVDPRVFAPLEPLFAHPDEPFAANALRIGDRLLHGAGHPRTRERLERRGLEVAPVDLGELAKAEGALTCCCLLVG